MSKRFARSLFSPYVCKTCRNRLATSSIPIRRTVVDVASHQQVANNLEQVQRRVQALGGQDELPKLYGQIPLRPREKLLTAEAFGTTYLQSWQSKPPEKQKLEEVVIYGRHLVV